MRYVTCFVLAAALGAAPALAQNEVAADNAVETNEVAAVPADNAVANDLATAPAAEPAATDVAAAPAPAAQSRKSGGFPWGAIGLVGLIGLLGRRRRD